MIAALTSLGFSSILDIDAEEDEVSRQLLAEVIMGEDEVLTLDEVQRAIASILAYRDSFYRHGLDECEFSTQHRTSLGGAGTPAKPSSSSTIVLPIAVPSQSAVRGTIIRDLPLLSAKPRRYQRTPRTDPDDIRPKRGRVEHSSAVAIPIGASEVTEKHYRMCESLWKVLAYLGSQSTHIASCEGKHDIGDLKTMVLAEWHDLPHGSVKHYVDTLARFKSFASLRDFNWNSPSIVQTASYIASTRERGPSVPEQELAAMKWLDKSLGLQWHSTSVLAKKQVKMVLRDPPRQAVPPDVAVMCVLEYHAASTNIYVSLIAAAGCLLAYGSVRMAHAQRSRVTKATSWYVEFLASRGKAKRAGIRRPFTWTSARHAIGGTDLYRPVERAIKVLWDKGELEADPFYLVPDFAPRGVGLEFVNAFYARPMSTARLMFYIRKVIMLATRGASQDVVKALMDIIDTLTGHSFRHLLITLAQRAMYSSQEQLTLGLWSRNESSNENSKLARQMAMPMLYASEAQFAQALGRTTLTRSLRRAVVRFMYDKLGFTSKKIKVLTILQCRVPSLDALAPYWPPRDIADEETCAWIRAKNNETEYLAPDVQLTHLADGPLPVEQVESIEDEKARSETSSETSESDSSLSTVSADPDELCCLHTERRDGKLHLMTPDIDTMVSGCTVCGRKLARPIEVQGIDEALRTTRQWSPRCWHRLSEEARRRWTQA